MTLIMAKIIDAGRVTLLSDTKVTDRLDESKTRRDLVNPLQKVVIVSDDVAVGFAGDTPDTAIRKIVKVRGLSVDEVQSSLLTYTRETNKIKGVSKSFLVVARRPEPRIIAIRNGEIEDRTAIGTGWVGDHAGLQAFTQTFTDLKHMSDLEARFFGAFASVVTRGDVDSVGGYVVRVSGDSAMPMRFRVNPGFMMPWFMIGNWTQRSPQGVSLRLSVPIGGDPTRHTRMQIPGIWPTYGALAHYIPEIGMAWLHTHEQPWNDPVMIAATSAEDLAQTARSNYGQHLDSRDTQYVINEYLR